MNYKIKIENLLIKYHNLTEELVESHPNIFDDNQYDMEGYWEDVYNYSELRDIEAKHLYSKLKLRVKAVNSFVESIKLLNQYPTIYS